MREKNRGSHYLKGLVLFVLVFGIVMVFTFTPLSISEFTPENIKVFIQKFEGLAPLIFILIYALRAVVLVIPSGIMSLAGGLAFGKWLGTIYILIGATIGSCISFLIARYLGRSFIERLGIMKNARIKKFDKGVESNSFRVILFLRLIPMFQYDAVNFGSGLSKMKFRHFALGSLMGMIPGSFVNAMLGSSLDKIISVQFFVSLGLFLLMMFIPLMYKTIRKRIKNKTALPINHNHYNQQTKKRIVGYSFGVCSQCGERVGPLAIIVGWDKWGHFICPGCNNKISFKGWLNFVIVFFSSMIGVERFLHLLLEMNIPHWVSFTIAFIAALLVMFLLPMLWRFQKVN